MEQYFNPEVECASREQITAWQNERLVKQVERVYNNVPYYRKKSITKKGKGLRPLPPPSPARRKPECEKRSPYFEIS